MGFNTVWVNPFFSTSNKVVVKRVNEWTGEPVMAKRSLYAMYDPALLYKDEDKFSNGNPNYSETGETEYTAQIKRYTKAAIDNGLTPIFDLVINHVAKDSPLVSNNFAHFKKIDTSKWFKKDGKGNWDDIAVFNYTPANIQEIFNYLWKPLIDKMVALGFQGVRIDYATGVNPEILKRCIDYIKTKGKDKEFSIVFGEALIPGRLDKRAILNTYKDVGFTNLTNLAVFLSPGKILKGKDEGYEWFLEDQGLKRAITFGNSKYRNGTIGFPGLHDHGTSIQAAITEEISNFEYNQENVSESEQTNFANKIKEIKKGKVIGRKIQNLSDFSKKFLAKERMLIAALSSDAGWYCFSGDEILSTTTKRPFVKENEEPFGGHTNEATLLSNIEKNSEMVEYITAINNLFQDLRESEGSFYVGMFYLNQEKSGMCFVRHLIKDGQRTADVVVADLVPNGANLNQEALKNFLETWSEIKQVPNWRQNSDIKYFFLNDYRKTSSIESKRASENLTGSY